MKKKYSAMTPAQRKANVENFRTAAKTARKPVAKGGNKPRQTTRKEAEARFYSSSSQGSIEKNRQKAVRNFSQSSSGTRGQSRPSNSAGPAVVKQGSRTGASVDPRERQLRKNREEARRGGSSSAGRANIRRMVEEQSGGGRRNQRQVEARRRRAREEAAKRNRRRYLASKNNDM
jgi:hypothetical protein